MSSYQERILGTNDVTTGFIYSSIDMGVTWRRLTTGGIPNGGYWRDIACSSDGTTVVSCIEGGKIYVSTNSGATWITPTSPTNDSWGAVAMSSDGTIMYAGTINEYSASIYKSTNSGSTWSLVSYSGTFPGLHNKIVCSTDGTKVAVLGLAGSTNNICYSSNGGTSWTAVTLPAYPTSQGYPHDIALSGDGSRLIVSTLGYVFYYSTTNLASATAYSGLSTSYQYTGV